MHCVKFCKTTPNTLFYNMLRNYDHVIAKAIQASIGKANTHVSNGIINP